MSENYVGIFYLVIFIDTYKALVVERAQRKKEFVNRQLTVARKNRTAVAAVAYMHVAYVCTECLYGLFGGLTGGKKRFCNIPRRADRTAAEHVYKLYDL